MARRTSQQPYRITVDERANMHDLYVRESLGVVLSMVGIFFLLALVSYRPQDTGLFYYDSDLFFVANWAGHAGAIAADILIYLFGVAAYLFIACCLLPGYFALFERTREQYWQRCAGLPLLIIAAVGLASQHQIDWYHSVAGGQFGFWIEYALESVCGVYGTRVVLWALAWIGMVLVMRVSLIGLLINASAWCVRNALVSRGVWYAYAYVHAMVKRFVRLLYRAKTVNKTTTNVLMMAAERVVKHEPVAAVAPEAPVVADAVQPAHTLVNNERMIPQVVCTKKVVTLDCYRERPDKKNLRCMINSVMPANIFFADGAEASAYELMLQVREYRDNEPLFVLPPTSLFAAAIPQAKHAANKEEARERGMVLVKTLQHFGINGSVTAIHPGPVITLYEYKPDANNKISKITALEDDLAMALQAVSIRIIAPIPGKDVIGFEIANKERMAVYFSTVVATERFEQAPGILPFIVGVNVVGEPVIEDLAAMPHLLVSGTTGSGKSVGLNVLLMSLLCKKSPHELRLILVDPKRLEFTPYADIPHLLFPIVTSPIKAVQVLKWVVHEMEQRYERMAHAAVRNIAEYQDLVAAGATDTAGNAFEPMPFIVVMIDELADLMMVAGKEVETAIIRIAQMARAAGIHLILATQRPSVDVVTGIIKVNFPSRMAFRVSSKVDSRTILDQQGAEKLLGKGDLLFMHAASPVLMRVHGAYVSDKEIAAVTTHLKKQQKVVYLDLNEALPVQQEGEQMDDSLYAEVLQFLKTADEISISSLQRQYRIGFNRSARIIEKLELDGRIAPAQGSKPRKVLR